MVAAAPDHHHPLPRAWSPVASGVGAWLKLLQHGKPSQNSVALPAAAVQHLAAADPVKASSAEEESQALDLCSAVDSFQQPPASTEGSKFHRKRRTDVVCTDASSCLCHGLRRHWLVGSLPNTHCRGKGITARSNRPSTLWRLPGQCLPLFPKARMALGCSLSSGRTPDGAGRAWICHLNTGECCEWQLGLQDSQVLRSLLEQTHKLCFCD